jgi:hypothetical protein
MLEGDEHYGIFEILMTTLKHKIPFKEEECLKGKTKS